MENLDITIAVVMLILTMVSLAHFAEPKARGELVMVDPEYLAKLEAENKIYRELYEQLDKVHTFAVAYVFLRERGAPVRHVDAGYKELKTALAEHGHWFRDKVRQAISSTENST